MENGANGNFKRAIILDMDETLLLQIHSDGLSYEETPMIFRPGLDNLIAKLKEAKTHGIEIVLCTTAGEQAIEKFSKLKPELKEIFDRILTGTNREEWMELDNENSHEFKVYGWSPNQKPITTFGYDQILFIDDNRVEGRKLEKLFQRAPDLEKDVTFISNLRFLSWDAMDMWYDYLEASYTKSDISNRFRKLIEIEQGEPGCNIMCSAIDTFINKEFKPGLITEDGSQNNEYIEYKSHKEKAEDELYDLLEGGYNSDISIRKNELLKEIMSRKVDFYKYFLEALGREQDTISPEQALRSALVGEVATSDLKNATVNGTHLEQTEQEVQQGE